MDEDGKVFVSDVIGDAYKDWKPGDLIGISAGTGTGKTEFALRIMAKEVQKQGKNILFLSNRNPLKEQTQKKVEKTRLDYSLITVMNYQALQSMIDQHMDLEHYDYIFADECHYLLSDAMMNSATDLSFDFLINNPDSVVILMSATGNKLFYWLTEIKRIKPENIYHLEQDYSHVDKVVLYDADAFFPLVNNLLDSDPDSKILVICNEKRMSAAYKRYGDSADYFCSKNTGNATLRKLCNVTEEKTTDAYGKEKVIRHIPEVIHEYGEKLITFDKRLLFSTRVLENGVSLKDTRIKAIFCELIDPDGIIQSLGRKRQINDNDTCTFYIRRVQTNWLNSILSRAWKNIKAAKAFYANDGRFETDYLQRRKNDEFREEYDVFYVKEEDASLAVNITRYHRYLMDYLNFNRIRTMSFEKVLPLILGEQLAGKIVTDHTAPDLYDPTLEYLRSLQGKKLYKEDQAGIKARFREIGLNMGKVVLKGKRPAGIAALNGVLDTRYGNSFKPRFFNQDPESGKRFRDKIKKLADGTDNPHHDEYYWLLQ